MSNIREDKDFRKDGRILELWEEIPFLHP